MGLKDWPAFAILAILATLVLVSHGSNRASSPIYSELPALRYVMYQYLLLLNPFYAP